MHKTFSRASFLAIVAAAAFSVTGCASVDDVKHAQSTADQALSTAQQAQQSAQAAQTSADHAQSDVNALSQRVDSLHPPRKGQRG